MTHPNQNAGRAPCAGSTGLLAAILCAAMLVSGALASLSLLSISSASAQSIADSFGGFSKKNNDPINIEADTLEVVDDKNTAVFSGNVKASQGKFVLIAKKLKVTYSRGGAGKKAKAEQRGIKRIDATGKVAISTPDNQSATSDWAKFDVLAKMITIGGNVVLSQGGNVMRGDKLVIDLNTGRSKFHSTSNTPGSKKGKRPRITGVFMPGKSGNKNPFKREKKKQPPVQNRQKNGPESQSGNAGFSEVPPLPWQKKQ